MSGADRDGPRHDLLALAELATVVARDLSDDIVAIAALASDALRAGGKLMFCGNGGSAADAQHLATEYVVRFQRDRAPLAAVALTTDTSLLTAAANDYGFEHVFARQVRALGQPGDVLFLHTTSGRSPNLLRAAEAAREKDVASVGILAGGGGELAGLVDRALLVPSDNAARAQEIQLAIGHIICRLVEGRLHAGD
jgi:D-sedoheptulose 7-phosphate isomerase